MSDSIDIGNGFSVKPAKYNDFERLVMSGDLKAINAALDIADIRRKAFEAEKAIKEKFKTA